MYDRAPGDFGIPREIREIIHNHTQIEPKAVSPTQEASNLGEIIHIHTQMEGSGRAYTKGGRRVIHKKSEEGKERPYTKRSEEGIYTKSIAKRGDNQSAKREKSGSKS